MKLFSYHYDCVDVEHVEPLKDLYTFNVYKCFLGLISWPIQPFEGSDPAECIEKCEKYIAEKCKD